MAINEIVYIWLMRGLIIGGIVFTIWYCFFSEGFDKQLDKYMATRKAERARERKHRKITVSKKDYQLLKQIKMQQL